MKQMFIIIAVIVGLLCTSVALVSSKTAVQKEKTATELCCKKQPCGGDNPKQKRADTQQLYMLTDGILGYQ